MRAIMLGIVASFFFAFTFVLNRAMDISGGSWVWSAVLRYLFMLPPLLLLVMWRGNLQQLFTHMRSNSWAWLGWSTVGFGLFYAPLCFAAAYGPAWLVASMWQITIVAGSLLAPLFSTEVETDQGRKMVRGKIPLKGLIISLLILAGVGAIQLQQAGRLTASELLLGILPVVVAAIAYPLGNRKMMEICNGKLDTYQRVLGMTLASIPFWVVLAIFGFAEVGAPQSSQLLQSMIVAVCSGVIATVLFFRATDLTGGDMHKLASVEATQSGEIIFSLFGEVLILQGAFPATLSILGIFMVILGMILHSFSHPHKS